jgi:hypothetical protein
MATPRFAYDHDPSGSKEGAARRWLRNWSRLAPPVDVSRAEVPATLVAAKAAAAVGGASHLGRGLSAWKKGASHLRRRRREGV